MGQKTHPELFRINILKNYRSKWYSNKFNYSKYLLEDFNIRNLIEQELNAFLTISNIKIIRLETDVNYLKRCFVKISFLLENEEELLEKFSEFFAIPYDELTLLSLECKIKLIELLLRYNLRNILRTIEQKYKTHVYINLDLFKFPFNDSTLIAKYIGTQLQKRIPYKRILRDIFKRIRELSDFEGIKIQISGRLNGQDMARTEWQHEGQISLHTLRAKINYSSYPVKTIYGIMGIKVWLYKK